MTRSPTYIDEVTLNAMITTGMMEALGPLHFTQFRVPNRQLVSETNSADAIEVDYRVGWMPKNMKLSSDKKEINEEGTKFKCIDKDLLAEFLRDEEPPKKDPRFLLPKLIMAEGESPKDKNIADQRQESIMQWFDRTVESELKRRKDISSNENIPSGLTDTIMPAKELNFQKSVVEKMAEASASRIETISQMSMIPDTELQDVVDKYAKAEAMCTFAGAVKAAEAAAEAAPPELAEEAALASARIYQSEMNGNEISEQIQGIRPMQVIGYIGVTKPKYPVRPEKK
ncbi:uncharacterized protein LOC130441519 [Diorhabda sublineata]|uniref:uncharacterized protein LOC130441519 n=1 Tax=Diorhabda sublineata TaxID=1163346 RepID=UPI0024E12AAA|nr:uncharacterized protein LOC130441519 [Diorhabda sublineata]